MSQQLQITGGAKVRSLEGVITGSTGVLGSLPINGANGIPQLDSNGKILVSQLPNSVMEYKGTWNVTTNTPYLVNGTGNTGDVYLVEGAATGGTSHDFGAGAITFYNGDQVIYSGSIWQRGAGSSGTVTSVAITESGDALTITGSPITNSGTINIGFAGTSAQYVAGNGTLVTFPTITTEAQRLITEVYNETGATLTKGTVVYINGGHGNLPTIAKALATSDATSAQTYGVVQSDIGNNNNGYVVVIGSLTDLDTQAYSNGTQLYLSPTTAGAWTSTKQYAPAHLVYVGIVTRSHPTQGVVEIKIQNGYELDELHNVSAQNPWQDDGLFYNYYTQLWENKPITSALGYTPVPNTRTLTINGVTYDLTANRSWTIATGISGSGTTNYISKWTGSTALGNSLIYDNGTNVGIGTASPTSKLSVAGTTAISGQLTLGDTITNGTYIYTLPGATGTLALTSDIPSVTNFVTLNTLQTIAGTKIYTAIQYFDNGVYIKEGISGSTTGYTSLGAGLNQLKIGVQGAIHTETFPTSASYTYTFPSATGTLALTSDLSSYVPTSRTLTINGTTYDLSANRSWTISGTSQWTTSGSDIYYNTGTVGIGTTTPTGLGTGYGSLDIRGTSGGGVAMGNATNIGYIYTDSALRLQTSSIPIAFSAGGSERMRVTTTGNVGIGTSSPSQILTVVGPDNTQNAIASFAANNLTQQVEIWYGGIKMGGTSSGADLNLAAKGNGNMLFSTNSSERMRITSGGQVLVGSTSSLYSNAKLSVKQTSANLTAEIWSNYGSDYGSPALTIIKNDNNTTQVFQRFTIDNGNAANGQINGNGASQVAFGTWSDRRLKDNIIELPSQLQNILLLKPCEFDYKNGSGHQIGFIAQEMQEVYPDAVAEDTDGFLTITGWSKTEARLVKAIQELEARLKTLENK